MSTQKKFSVYFGTASDAIYPASYLPVQTHDEFYSISAFKRIQKQYHLNNLALLHQIHGTMGVSFHNQASAMAYVPFSTQGDYLITTLKGIGIGIMTADCLPIVFYDAKNHAIATAHAGWRGAVAGIVARVIATMQEQCATHVDDLHILLGPSARACCYQVGSDIVTEVSKTPHQETIFHRSSGSYFDLGHFVVLQLQHLGVLNNHIDVTHNVCTICNHEFFSYRRQGVVAGRQLTLALLG